LRILAIETSTPVGSVAVVEDGKLRVEKQFNVGRSHCQRLMSEIDDTLRSSGTSVEEIDMMATGIGPGSFTGLRVGLSTLKGMAMGLGVPVVPVSTLQVLAYNGRLHRGLICPCLDAKKKQVYYSLFRSDRDGVNKLLEDSVGIPGEITSVLNDLDGEEGILFLGDGATLYRDVLTETLMRATTFAEGGENYPRASIVGMLAAAQPTGDVDLSVLEPRYIRESEARIGKGKQ
jgi:tRNA threonylcarbamoyladenosine biosynthesis protein TsaB